MHVGLDRLVQDPSLGSLMQRLREKKVGLLAHPASVSRDLLHISDVLDVLRIRPVLFFGPEHGYGGEAQDMVGVDSARDSRSGAAIVSLYSNRFEDLSPRAEHLSQIEVLLVDLSDVGSRYYTFVWTALLALREAARAGVHVVVLDRPNPLGGSPAHTEGATQRQDHLSFVGLVPIPIRHGLTVGEILAWRTAEEKLGEIGPNGVIEIVSVRGWDRNRLANAWDRPFVFPSPNMPTADTALVYPGGCLIEGTHLSEGRGTTRPFEIVGAPWLEGRRLAAALEDTGLPGFVARPLTFRPTFQKHAGELCGGVQMHVTDASAFRPVATYTALIALAHRQRPDLFRFRTEPYEYNDTVPALDLLTGSPTTRESILAGKDPLEIAEAVSAVDPCWGDEMARAQSLARMGADLR